MKGVLYQEDDAGRWQAVVDLRPQLRDHVAALGLDLVVDESEGYAYLCQRSQVEGEVELPKLVARRALGYHVSLLLALLRRRLAEFDQRSAETRLVLKREEIVEMFRAFLTESSDEARVIDKIDQHLARVEDMGFLRRLDGAPVQFEVRRILKAFVNARWLGEISQLLETYRRHAVEASRSEKES